MAKKKNREQPKREFTKKQLSQWEKQKKRQRIIFITGIAVVTVVVLGLVLGWYFSMFRPLQALALKIGDTEYKVGYYVDTLKYYGVSSITESDNVVNNIQQSQMIIKEAEAMGITINKDEIEKQLSESGLPSNGRFIDPVKTQIALVKLRDEYFDKQVPEKAEHRNIKAMFLESQVQANDVKSRIEAGESFTLLAGELSAEPVTKEQNGDLGWRPKGVLNILMENQLLDDQAFNAKSGEITEPIYDAEQQKDFGYWIMKVLERDVETATAHVQGILLESEAKAIEVKAKLEAGENFADLASEYSQYLGNKDQGGDFGMVSEGMFGGEAEAFIFNEDIEVRTVSDPLKDETFDTKGGFWLINIEGIEERDVEGENRDILKTFLLREWVDGLKDMPGYEIENFMNEAQKKWALDQALR
ncbi:peptidylprolyl isomerase [Chloroflexota bacterium]